MSFPKDLINAFVAIEDSRFWTHNGIDLRSIARMIKGVITGDSSAGGGSTITQQLIKNNVFGGGREKSFGETVERKLQEQYLAVKLSKTMSKELVLTNYLNTINLGNNTLGVKVAARRYFGKEVSDLHPLRMYCYRRYHPEPVPFKSYFRTETQRGEAAGDPAVYV